MEANLEHSARVWQRLRENGAKNAPQFAEAHIAPERAAEVVCPACGASESALFWPIARRRDEILHLQCPFCGKQGARFSLRQNRAIDPPSAQAFLVYTVVGLLVMLAGGAIALRDTPQARWAVERLWADGETAVEHTLRTARSLFYRGWDLVTPSHPPQAVPAPVNPLAWLIEQAPERPAGGGSGSFPAAPRISSPPSTQPTSLGTPARVPRTASRGVYVFVAQGDRRSEISLYAERILESRGEREAWLLQTVEYLPASDQTRVIVDTTAVEWQRYLHPSYGWRRAND